MTPTSITVEAQTISIPQRHFQALFTALEETARQGNSSFEPNQEHTLYELLWNCWRIEAMADAACENIIRLTLPRGIKLAVLETLLSRISPFVHIPDGATTADLLVRYSREGRVSTFLYRFSAATLDKFVQVVSYEKADLALLPA